MELAASHPDWAIGFEDETWWSRFIQPNLHAWTEGNKPLRLVEQAVSKDDPDPKAVACYGLLVRDGVREMEEIWLRFVDGRPVSSLTTVFLEWCCGKLELRGKKALLLVWDNASWHVSKQVRRWIGEYNRQVKREGQGVRIVTCLLPIKSPWLNAIEPYWVHGKRKVVEADGLLSAQELIDRACTHFGCAHEEHLSIIKNVS
ncbi:MAG: transposase [Candidatus Marsarchaeota archaeon]|nr:transposase [Candidatus Marsarchaeota archaeon]